MAKETIPINKDEAKTIMKITGEKMLKIYNQLKKEKLDEVTTSQIENIKGKITKILTKIKIRQSK